MVEERTHNANIRLTPDEWASWNAAARAAGYGRTAAWVRETLRAHTGGGATKYTRIPEAVDGQRELAAQIARVGSNLNQIARALNVEARTGETEVGAREVAQALEDVRAQLRALRAGAER